MNWGGQKQLKNKIMEKIVETLVAQHKVLQQNLGAVSKLADLGESFSPEIVAGLAEFTNNLMAHLKLEDEEFYPELLKKMEEKDMDVLNTKKFIDQMKTIAVVVTSFLGKYGNVKAYKGTVDEFKKDLAGIIQALSLRVESEEMGVFTYWTIFEKI